MLLDYARRCFERKGDKERAEELRKYFRQTVTDSVVAVRALVPEEMSAEYTHLEMNQLARLQKSRKTLSQLRKEGESER